MPVVAVVVMMCSLTKLTLSFLFVVVQWIDDPIFPPLKIYFGFFIVTNPLHFTELVNQLVVEVPLVVYSLLVLMNTYCIDLSGVWERVRL